MSVWALVPARGGSKSIPLKNLARLAGRPMLDYGVKAAQASGCCDRIVCSTDHDAIAARSRELGIECDARPPELARDDTRVADVVLEWLARQGQPDMVVLIQPTSPLVRPADIRAVVDALTRQPEASTAQTIAPVPHNHHAWNQRNYEGGLVRFQFAAERRTAVNKQAKRPSWVFGNVVVARPVALTDALGFFAEPSVGIPIERPYDFDVDGPADLAVAEALLQAGAVTLAGE